MWCTFANMQVDKIYKQVFSCHLTEYVIGYFYCYITIICDTGNYWDMYVYIFYPVTNTLF